MSKSKGVEEVWHGKGDGIIFMFGFASTLVEPPLKSFMLVGNRIPLGARKYLSTATHQITLFGTQGSLDPEASLFKQLHPKRWTQLKTYQVPAGDDATLYARFHSCQGPLLSGLLRRLGTDDLWTSLLFLPPGEALTVPTFEQYPLTKSRGSSTVEATKPRVEGAADDTETQ